MIDDKVAKLILEHTPREGGASFMYSAMALWANRQGLFQFEAWLRKNSREELDHRDKLLDYLNDFNQPVCICMVNEREVSWKDITTLLGDILKAETLVYEKIAAIVQVAANANDWLSFQFLQWFIDEQNQSIAYALDMLAKWDACKGVPSEFDEWFE